METISNTVSAIYNEAQSNEIFGAICYDFANRKRTRETLTIRGLKARLEKQGADFKDEEYRKVFEFLAKQGLGRLALDKKNRISALKNIPVTLQSIGEASGLKTKMLDTFSPQRKFKTLPVPVAKPPEKVYKLREEHKKIYTAHLVIKRGDNPITLPGPVQLSAVELGEFLIEYANMVKKPGQEV